MGHTKSVMAVDIRQFPAARRLKAWLRAGKTVEVRDRDRVIVRIVPVRAPQSFRRLPDFAAMRREIFGSRMLPGSDLLIEERGRF